LTDVGSSGHVDTARAEEDERVADFYIKDGNYAGAYLRYKDAVVFSPDDPEAHFGLAEMARRKGNKAEAMAEYTACLKVDPQGKHVKEARKALAELEQEEHKQAAAAGAR
jgi:Flp pilus assembly protein TadD